jgi:hypothetical protein
VRSCDNRTDRTDFALGLRGLKPQEPVHGLWFFAASVPSLPPRQKRGPQARGNFAVRQGWIVRRKKLQQEKGFSGKFNAFPTT